MKATIPRSLAIATSVVVMLLAGATPAFADPATPTNYWSEVTGVEGSGISEVEIIGGDAFVRLTATPGVAIELLGFQNSTSEKFAVL